MTSSLLCLSIELYQLSYDAKHLRTRATLITSKYFTFQQKMQAYNICSKILASIISVELKLCEKFNKILG